VKICNLYGDGFYFLPGTNICVKIGGYVRGEYTYGAGASQTNGPYLAGTFNGISGAAGSATGPNGYNTRWDGGDWVMRSRAYISMDTREQTEWGVLRTYLNIGLNYDSPAAGAPAIFSGNRAFIQFAGFTVGLAQSFYDFYCVPCSQYLGLTPASDTGDGGWKVIAYSLIWGAGITSTLSLEEPRRIGIVNTNAAANPFTIFGSAVGQNGITTTAGADSAKERFPDIVANLRIDQALYTAQVMFAAHDASAAYYFSTLNAVNGIATGGGVNCPPGTLGTAGSIIGSEVCGHPADKMGWAAGAGFRINLPNTNGSYFQIQYNYTVGAARYADQTQTGYFSYVQGGTLGYGILTDGIVNNATGTVDLTKVQGLNVAFDYHWNGKFWTSIFGSYLKISYDGIANASIWRDHEYVQRLSPGGRAAVHGGRADPDPKLPERLELLGDWLTLAVQLHARPLCRHRGHLQQAAERRRRGKCFLAGGRCGLHRGAGHHLPGPKPEYLVAAGPLPPRYPAVSVA
jgi:hypothetical protein